MAPRGRKKNRAVDEDDDMTAPTRHTLVACLDDLQITAEDLEPCQSLDEEFKVIKQSYFDLILKQHPDKGGSPEQFRQTRAAFEVLRKWKNANNDTGESFSSHLGESAEDYNDVFDNLDEDNVPSYEYYYEAAQEQVPGYKVELAKTGRSQCVFCKKNGRRRARKKSSKPPPKKRARRFGRDKTEENAVVAAPAPPTEEDALVPARSQVFIEKNAIRVGSLDEKSGGYGRWHHLPCWRVPYRIWAGLTDPKNEEQVWQDLLSMDEVLLTNLSALPDEDQLQFVRFVMGNGNWARQTKSSNPPPNLKKPQEEAQDVQNKDATTEEAVTTNAEESTVTAVASSSVTLVARASELPTSSKAVAKKPSKTFFAIPKPGVNGAIPDCLQDHRFVLTGLFPEVGGGTGLNLGKDKVKAMIEEFGGRVTGSVSGKTNFVVVGKDPGRSKVTEARKRDIPLIDLNGLQNRILGNVEALEDTKPAVIKNFSEGYNARRIGYY